MINKSLICILVLLLSGLNQNLHAQDPTPAPGIVFDDSYIPTIEVYLDSDSLDALLMPGNEYSNHEYPATFVFKCPLAIDTMYNVGFRLRGNTSRVAAKKSFKVSFNTFTNQDFYGLDKLNLNGEHNDPSIIRSKIFWDLCASFSNLGSRANHAQLFINNEYKGLYINVEHVDEEFIETRFGKPIGNLYKCLYPADLAWLSSNPNDYKFTQYGRRVYDLKTNRTTDDYSGLAHFINVLNNTPDQDFKSEIESVFNVNEYLKYLALEVFTGNWDGYSYNKNNYYLYDNPRNGKFEFIPYDTDNTFGIDWMGIDWGIRSIYSWPNEWEDRVLTGRILSVPEYRYRYEYYLRCLCHGAANYDSLSTRILAIRMQIEPAVQQDMYHSLDYGYTFGDFMSSYVLANGDHVTYGLLPYIETRRNSILAEVGIHDFPPIISRVNWSDPDGSSTIRVEAKIENDGAGVLAWIKYGSGPQNLSDSLPLFDDGQHNDSYAQDLVFANVFEPDSTSTSVHFFLVAYENNGLTSRFPRSGTFEIQLPSYFSTGLVINEIMAKNTSSIADEAGEYDDWIELYNNSNETIFLGNYYLSDRSSNPYQWNLPADSLAPGSYALIWADNDLSQGPMHASFKLSSSGEEVILTHIAAPGNAPTDHIDFGPLPANRSYARYPNGSGPLSTMLVPTPFGSNNYVPLDTELPEAAGLEVYPNPVRDRLIITLPPNTVVHSLRVLNTQSALLYSSHPSTDNSTITLSMMNLRPGMYFLYIEAEQNGEILYFYSKVIRI